MPGGVRVGQVESTRIQVEETGVRVDVRDAVHAHTNHYIKESRPYFPNTKLPTYIDCPYFLRIACFLCILSSFGVLGVTGNVTIPLVFFVACSVFFSIYCQHEWVNQKSLPVVLKQPVFDGQERGNNFYEVTFTELKGMALENYQAGIGFVEVTQGKIKFQAFNNTAVKRMCRAKWYSRLMMFLFFVMAVYNFSYMLVASSKR